MEDLELAAQTAVGAEADSSARLQEACLEIASLRSEADDARQRCDRLAETNGQLEKEKEALTRRVSELSDELAAAKEELLERRRDAGEGIRIDADESRADEGRI